MDGCTHFAQVTVSVAHSLRKCWRCEDWEDRSWDRHAPVLPAAIRPDIRCHPVAIHLLLGIGFIVIFLISGRHQLETFLP